MNELVSFCGSRFDCKNCYEDIDQAQKEICELEEYISRISEQASLFEVSVPDFRGVKMCRKEIKMIKVTKCPLPLHIDNVIYLAPI